MEFPKDLLFTMEHEWVRIDDNKGVVGISEFAQDHRRSPRAGATGLADQGDQQTSGKGDTRPPR